MDLRAETDVVLDLALFEIRGGFGDGDFVCLRSSDVSC